jgi:hypothetical protein
MRYRAGKPHPPAAAARQLNLWDTCAWQGGLAPGPRRKERSPRLPVYLERPADVSRSDE